LKKSQAQKEQKLEEGKEEAGEVYKVTGETEENFDDVVEITKVTIILLESLMK